MRKILLLLLLLTLPGWAQPYSLAQLMGVLKAHYATAEVIASFNDWRTLSIYRSHAGLHYGYDIALPYGSEVPTVWPGRVVAVTPWFGEQYGISVESAGGIETTYGHLVPLVSVGQTLASGQPLGRTVINHVDVKMRDAQGYVDFGQGWNGVAGPSLEDRLGAYRQALKGESQAQSELASWDARVALLREAQRKAEGGLNPSQVDDLLADGAISRVQAQEARQAGTLPARLAKATGSQKAAREALKLAHQQTQLAAGALNAEEQRKVAVARPTVVSARVAKGLTPDAQKLVDEGIITRAEAEHMPAPPPAFGKRPLSDS